MRETTGTQVIGMAEALISRVKKSASALTISDTGTGLVKIHQGKASFCSAANAAAEAILRVAEGYGSVSL